MAYLDACIYDIRELVMELGKNRKTVSVMVGQAGMPSSLLQSFLIGEKRNGGMVSFKDTFVELGHPTISSLAISVWTDNPSLVLDNTVTVIGDDIPLLGGGRYPFVQVILAEGRDLRQEQEPLLQGKLSASDQLWGCMTRISRGKIWTRISKDAVRRGFSLSVLGEMLLWVVKAEIPQIKKVEAIFLTTGDKDVSRFSLLDHKIRELKRNMIKLRMNQSGENQYECDNPYDCNVCSDKAVCDVLKETAAVIKQKMGRTYGLSRDTGNIVSEI